MWVDTSPQFPVSSNPYSEHLQFFMGDFMAKSPNSLDPKLPLCINAFTMADGKIMDKLAKTKHAFSWKITTIGLKSKLMINSSITYVKLTTEHCN